MRFSTISAVLAMAATAIAQTANFDAITAPTQDQKVAAGSTLDIVWQPTAAYSADTITITLLEGATPATLQLGAVVASGIKNTAGKFSWAIPADIKQFATYGFQITLDSNKSIFQYSFPFHITATSTSSSSSATGSVSAASTKTMTLSTGPAYTYTPISTSSAITNSSSAVKTSSYPMSTLSTATAIKPTGNSTLTYISPSATAPSTSTNAGTGSATTSTGPASVTKNAAMSNMASGSIALIGGMVLALAL